MNMTAIFDDQLVFDAAERMSIEAVSLIKNVPLDCLEEIQKAVMRNYQQLPLPEGRSLTEQLQEILGSTQKRAHTIARDQTSKIHSAVHQARMQSVGIEEYEWITARDRRVAGTPGGEWPNAKDDDPVHGNHYKRHGQIYRVDSPPKDGPPGYAPNCRCYPRPILQVGKLRQIDAAQAYQYGMAA